MSNGKTIYDMLIEFRQIPRMYSINVLIFHFKLPFNLSPVVLVVLTLETQLMDTGNSTLMMLLL